MPDVVLALGSAGKYCAAHLVNVLNVVFPAHERLCQAMGLSGKTWQLVKRDFSMSLVEGAYTSSRSMTLMATSLPVSRCNLRGL